MRLLDVLLVSVALFRCATALDGAPECPSPWLPEGNKCYLFSQTNRRSWLDAKIFCEKRGALLISINSDIENAFVQNWLSLNDNNPGSQNQWYTSGHTADGTPRDNPTFQWLDGTGFGSKVFWTNPETPRTDTGDYVVYKFANTGNHESSPGYFWVRDNGALPRAFICEINKADSEKINSKDRDFEYGVDNIHPDEIYKGPYFVSQPGRVRFQLSVDGTKCTQNCPTASFDCEARGFPQPRYRWFQDTATRTVPISSTSDSTNHMTITNGRLTIHNPKRVRDTSRYWCEASNRFGKIRSEKGSIDFITLDEFPKNSKDVHAKAYEAAVIVCQHTRREGIRYNYRWFMNNDPTKWVNPVYNSHIFLSASGNLYFSSVTASDDARYHCTVSIEDGDESRSSPAYHLVVAGSPSYQDVGPEIHDDFIKIIPKNPLRGDLVYLECFARFTRRSGEAARYKWTRKDGRNMPEGHEVVDYKRRLILHNVKPEDEGEYICTVSSQQSSKFKSIPLKISSKPYFGEGRLDNQHLDIGKDFSWTCLASAEPPPTYLWYRNASLFDADNLPRGSADRITFHNNKQTVRFKGLDKDKDPGMYQCAAKNDHGTTYSSAQMRILEFGPTFTKHPMLGKVLATEGGNATISCDPEAAPAATITWLKDGAAYEVSKDSKSPKRLLPNNYLFLSGIQKNIDEGVYTCVAENNVQNKETGDATSVARANIHLKVVQRSRLAFGPIDQKKLLYSKVVLECRADFNPILDLVYLWYHNGRLINFDDWKMTQIYRRGEGVNRGDLLIPRVTYEERGQYRCTVLTKSDSATLSAEVIVFGPPGEPAGIRASNPGQHSVIVTWSKGAENGAPVIAYIVDKYNEDTKEWKEAKKVTSANDLASGNTTVTDLFANTGYIFKVKAENEYGVGVPSVQSLIVKTTPSKPTTYPARIRGGGGKEGTLVIEWDPLPKEQWNAPNVFYMVQYRGAGVAAWSGCNGGIAISHSDKKAGKCVVTLGRDKFYLPYDVRVWARNDVGDGKIPDFVRAMSAVKVPTLTPQQIVVQPFNATALTVYWDPIPNSREVTGGELTGFHVQYWKDGTEQKLGRRNTILGNVTEGMIIGLEYNTDYIATAQLFNSAGDAPPGRKVGQTTWFNAPLNMPEYVTLNKTGDRTVGVHFRGVTTGPEEEPLDGYKVRVWRRGEPVRNAKDYDCGRRTWIMMNDNFEANEVYNLRVFGYSRGGVGKMSSPLIQFTIGCNRRRTSDDEDSRWVYLCSNCNQVTLSYTIMSAAMVLSHYLTQFL